jgi:hypothetical protein
MTQSPNPSPQAVLDALLSSDWMIRRKDVVEFGSESLLRRSHSFDFEIPSDLLLWHDGRQVAHVPLGYWWKAPGKYSNIDFLDEHGTSLPLSTSSSDEALTVQVLLELATRILCVPISQLNWKTVQDISVIVEQDAVWARAEAKDWREAADHPPSCPIGSASQQMPSTQSDWERAFLAQDEEFIALLEISAMASIFTVLLTDRLKDRRVIKLRYDETCSGKRGTDTFKVHSTWKAQARAKIRSALLLLGLAPYEVDIANAYVRSDRYHFEGDAPVGLRYTNVGYKTALKPALIRAHHSNPRVHLHDSNVHRDTYFSVRGSLVVSDDWITLAFICTLAAIAVLIGVIINVDSLDPTTSQSVIALAVLVPSIATSIVWRRVHWLVTRLQRWLRFAFGLIGLSLFYLALRIAESPTTTKVVDLQVSDGSQGLLGSILKLIEPDQQITLSRLADASAIRTTAWFCLIWAVIVGLALIAARIRSTAH